MEHSDNPENYRELGQSVELESDPCREPERGRIQRTQQGESRELEEQDLEGTMEYSVIQRTVENWDNLWN